MGSLEKSLQRRLQSLLRELGSSTFETRGIRLVPYAREVRGYPTPINAGTLKAWERRGWVTQIHRAHPERWSKWMLAKEGARIMRLLTT